jgi:hypothetical protein
VSAPKAEADSAPRYIIGIDLGTTNTALAWVDTKIPPDAAPVIENFPIPQVTAAGEVGEDALLPSFLYLPGAGEFDADQLTLPWSKRPDRAVGRFAREHGSATPTRLVSSSKSWLCHPGVDRRGKILPWLAEEDFAKISPVEAAVATLSHLKEAWNHGRAARDKGARLEHQEIVLTVPASFDAVARELTVEAAREAGFVNLTLFEEPQAAFHAWLHEAGERWRKQARPSDVILVVDVGGGTTDFTLIAVRDVQGDLELHRLAVGDHLLLGGDNMDLALAHHTAAELAAKGTKLDSAQMLGLWHACRGAKEKLFENPKLKSHAVTVLGRGRKVIGGTIRGDLTRDAVEKVMIDGFFPTVGLDARPNVARGLGLAELGLAYAADPAITKHLAAFLTRHEAALAEARPGQPPVPTAILFNGGVFKAGPLKERLLETVSSWAIAAGGQPVRELDNAGLDLAVARGAVAFGLTKRGRGIRIRGGVARSYYVGIESAMPAVPGFAPPIKALCVVPQGTEEGAELPPVGREFGLLVGEPSVFRLLSSTQRKDDRAGMILEDWQDTIDELAPMETVLSAADGERGSLVPVRIRPAVTEIGTLEIWCESRDGSRRWKLEFQVRDPER